MKRLFCLVICAIWLICGCTASQTNVPTPVAIPAAESQTPTPQSQPTVLPIVSHTPQTLVVWIIDLVAPLQDTKHSHAFEQQIAAFQATHPQLTVEVYYKSREGKGGMHDFLTTASAVAPAVVPDLIVVDTLQLPELAQKDLLVPLDDLVSPDLLSDLYPFAVDACTVDGQLMGLQFMADIEHAVYNTSKIAVPPITWQEVFASGATYIMPLSGQEGIVNDAFLIQYLSAGGDLLGVDDEPALDPAILSRVLGFYQQGIESGTILTQALSYQRVEDCWPTFLQAEVVLSNLSSSLYLSGRSLLEPVSMVTLVPTFDGHAVALSRGYAWAMTTLAEGDREISTQLLQWLMYPVYLASWNTSAGHLPTCRSSFEQMPRDTFSQFIYNQLERTVPYQATNRHLDIYRAMQSGIDAVLLDNVPPDEAAVAILAAVGQEGP